MDAFRWCISNRYPHTMREALTARFILKGIPEPLNVRRAVDKTLTLFLFNTRLIEGLQARYSNAAMKLFNSVKLTWLMSFGLLSCLVSKADTIVPCLIFSGNADTEHSIDLAKLNRITFGNNSMVISSSKDDASQSVELLYSLYHHLEIGDATPTDLESGIESVDADSDSRIYVDTQAKLLYLQSASAAKFSIGIFNISGHLLLSAELNNGDAATLETLSPGMYIAVASDGKTKLSLKFILN